MLTLSSPLTLNPAQAEKIQIKTATLDFQSGSLTIYAVMLDGSDVQVGDKSLTISGPAAQSFLDAVRTQLHTKLKNKLGVSGTES